MPKTQIQVTSVNDEIATEKSQITESPSLNCVSFRLEFWWICTSFSPTILSRAAIKITSVIMMIINVIIPLRHKVLDIKYLGLYMDQL